MPSMRAIQVNAPGGAFELVNTAIPVPGDEDILIRVEACGVCHGDALVREGRYPACSTRASPGTRWSAWCRGGQNAAEWQGRPAHRRRLVWRPCRKCNACRRGEFH